MSFTTTESLLQKLIGFPTVSRDSNMELIEFIQDYLGNLGIECSLSRNDEGNKANLYAVFGPEDIPGVMLSGHSDVVPIDGQDWTVDPFNMSEQAGRLYGRGTTDMKGFIASVLAMVPEARKRKLKRPIHLAFSYDEEIGCVGVQKMLDELEGSAHLPAFCIIGEPTEMQVAVAHKGKTGAICTCRGVEAHSALATQGLNAIYLANDVIGEIRRIQQQVIQNSQHDPYYNVPYTTLHVGTITGGTALNIIPKECSFKFEIRNLEDDDPTEIMHQIQDYAENLASDYRADFPDVGIEIEIFNQYPGLSTKPEEEVVRWVQSLVNSDRHIKLAFGTEGGLFQKRLEVPTVVCGPGSMDQGHKPDEFIAREELNRCDQFLHRLLDEISE